MTTTTDQTPTLDFDGKQYHIASLSEQARTQIGNVQVADQEIARLRVQLGLAQTARAAYLQALRAQLPAA